MASDFVRRVGDVDDEQRQKKLNEFLNAHEPEFSNEAFDQLWNDNRDLRERLVWAQMEYDAQRDLAAKMRRQYTACVRDMEAQRQGYERVLTKQAAKFKAEIADNLERLGNAREKLKELGICPIRLKPLRKASKKAAGKRKTAKPSKRAKK